MSPLLAQSRHCAAEFQCPLLGVKRTWNGGCVYRKLKPEHNGDAAASKRTWRWYTEKPSMQVRRIKMTILSLRLNRRARETVFGFGITCAALIFLDGALAAEKHQRTYQECRKLAISEGVPIRDPEHYRGNYKALESMELSANPRGFIARCMASKAHR
jgi:hypothetical protein